MLSLAFVVGPKGVVARNKKLAASKASVESSSLLLHSYLT